MAMYNTKLNYNGEPCTWRHVSTVRGQALGNLPQKCGKAPSAEPTIYKDGKYCTFPHTIEFLNKPYADIFTILTSYPSLENYLSPFMDAWKGGAQDQLQGQIASAKIPLSRMISPQLYWVMTGDDFTLDLNNPNEPKILCVGNNPDRQNIYSAALGLYNSRIVKLVNKKGQLKSSIIIDELPTIYFRGIDNLIATARSNKVAVCLGFQDYSQLARDYGDKEAKVIQNTVGNIFSGQVVGETATADMGQQHALPAIADIHLVSGLQGLSPDQGLVSGLLCEADCLRRAETLGLACVQKRHIFLAVGFHLLQLRRVHTVKAVFTAAQQLFLQCFVAIRHSILLRDCR